ncbi:MAG: hypothetical protein WAS21_22635 [Geminicoccaceae bacterium]
MIETATGAGTGRRRRTNGLRCLASVLTLTVCPVAWAANVWDTPVTRSARINPAAHVAGRDVGLSTWLHPDGNSLPIYAATARDPLVPILYVRTAWSKVVTGEWARAGNPPNIEAEIRAAASEQLPSQPHVYSSQSASRWILPATYARVPLPEHGALRAYVPRIAIPALGSDGHLAIRQPNGRVLELYAAIKLSSGELVAINYNLTNPSGPLDGSQGGVTASMLPVYAGVIRQAEVQNGRIGHAMKILMPAALLSTRYVYPAVAFDRGALTEEVPYAGTLPMGGRLIIPANVDIGRLGLSSQLGHIIASAAQDYGFIIADRGGNGITIAVERDVTLPELVSKRPAERRDLGIIMRALSLATATSVPAD